MGEHYSISTLKAWISPSIDAHDEFSIYEKLSSWPLDVAVALWLNINPFILSQASRSLKPDVWNTYILAHVRANFNATLNIALSAAIEEELQAKLVKSEYYVTPYNFYHWGIQNLGTPKEQPYEFFEKLKKKWPSSQITATKKPTYVNKKREEINRILDLIRANDSAFDHSNMPGRKVDFQEFCIKHNKSLFSVANETFSDYLT